MRNGSVPEVTTHRSFVPDRGHHGNEPHDMFGRQFISSRKRRRHPDGYPSARMAVTLSMLFWPFLAAVVFIIMRAL